MVRTTSRRTADPTPLAAPNLSASLQQIRSFNSTNHQRKEWAPMPKMAPPKTVVYLGKDGPRDHPDRAKLTAAARTSDGWV